MVPFLCHHVVIKTPHINGERAMILVYNSKHHHLVHVPVVPDCFIQFYRTERTMGSPVCGVWGEVKSAGFSRCYLLVVFSRPSYLTSWYLSSPAVRQKHQ